MKNGRFEPGIIMSFLPGLGSVFRSSPLMGRVLGGLVFDAIFLYSLALEPDYRDHQLPHPLGEVVALHVVAGVADAAEVVPGYGDLAL